MNFEILREYIGNLNQIMPAKMYRFCGGKMDGVLAVDLSNGAGLTCTVLPDRCMDLYSLQLNGKSLNYLSPAGITHPTYGLGIGDRWLSTFPGGFLSTCGLGNIGSPSESAGKSYPLHGEIGNIPAEEISFQIENPDTAPVAVLRGTIREAAMFGTNLSLTREIRVTFGNPEIQLTDTITNHSFDTTPFMTLYHFNMGYPLLSEKAELIFPEGEVKARTPHAQNHIGSYNVVEKPQAGFQEMCYYHTFKGAGPHTVGVRNPAENLTLTIQYSGETLDHFMQWKMMGQGTYAMGLEPCNATIEGRDDAKNNGTLKTLAPGATTKNQFVIRAES